MVIDKGRFFYTLKQMGGNALKTIQTRRYNRDEYLTLKEIVETKLKPVFADLQTTLAFRNKKDFGDMDCLVSYPIIALDGLGDFSNQKTEKEQINWIQSLIQKLFNPDEIFVNDDVYSFNFGIGSVKDFQIDLILCQKYFSTTLFYYKAGDLGNLIGRVAYSIGLELGHKQGLVVRYETKPNNALPPIVLTNKNDEILNYLGFDSSRFHKEFETQEEIFDYAISSSKFAGYLYKWENLNNENRTRNKKRPFYQDFVKYLYDTGAIEINRTGTNIFDFSFEELKFLKIQAIRDFNKEQDLHDLLSAKRIEDVIRSRFNGNLVQKITGIKEGKVLGEFIQQFKNSFSNHLEFENLILDLENNVELKIKEFAENFLSNIR